MNELTDGEHHLLLYTLGNITADAVIGDAGAFEALADPFWVQVIRSLDNFEMNYEAYIAATLRLRAAYKRREAWVYGAVREMRNAAALADGKGSRKERREGSRGALQGLLSKRAG